MYLIYLFIDDFMAYPVKNDFHLDPPPQWQHF
jgi:hypothetical protein